MIENINIHNFKSISDLNFDLGGSSVYVTGGNGAGKSSFISAAFVALTGKNIPPNPIKKGEKEAKIEVELESHVVELTFKKDRKGKIKKELALFNKLDGEKLDSPRDKINQMIGVLDFDAFKFMRLQPKPQLDYFCDAFGVEGVKNIDLDYREINEVISFDKKRKASLENQIEYFEPEDAAKQIVTVSELNTEYLNAVAYNDMTEEFRVKTAIKAERIEAIKKEIEALELECEICAEDFKKGTEWLSDRKDIDTSELKLKMANIETENDKIREAKKFKLLADEADKLEESLNLSNETKVKLLNDKKKLIHEHTKNIKGLDYTEEGFTLEGLPFHVDQNNTAAQIIAGLKLGSQLLGDVKIARFDGSLLDSENLEDVQKFAKENKLQLFIEVVDRDNSELKINFIEK